MSHDFTVEQLIDTLINYWSCWEENELFYLLELVPKLKANPECGNEKEAEIFKMLRNQLSEIEWKKLSDLISQRQQLRLRDSSQFKPLRKPFPEWREEARLVREDEERTRQKALRVEAEERERARIEKLRQEAEAKRKESLAEIEVIFNKDFLGADAYFKSKCDGRISQEEYKSEKSAFVQRWIKAATGDELDPEQAAAVAAVNGDTLITARAGSGKTKTVVDRAVFLQLHCGVSPDEMLLVAFNRKAVAEIKGRLNKLLKGQVPHVMTFHALAYALVHPEQDLLHDDPQSMNQGLSCAIQAVIDDHLQMPAHKKQIRELMLGHFRRAWERIVEGHFDKSKEEMLRLKRTAQRQSMQGEYVKSFGEKVIADFLFEHDMPYLYERNYYWDNINYKPDFTVFRDANKTSGIIIEYFGMQGDPDYDEMSGAKQMFWKEKKEWKLLSITPEHINKYGVEKLREKLVVFFKKEGISCNKLSEDEIWNRVKKRAIDEFTKTMTSFISRCRMLCLSSQTLNNLTASYSAQTDLEKQFLGIASNLYSAYLERLTMQGEEDFNGLMQRAAEAVAAGKTVFKRKSERGDINKLRYVFIDEFQDFSELFYRLVIAIRKQRPLVEFFCVGDDWQAINAFAGAELRFFRNEKQYFQWAHQLNITTNYRSPRLIVQTGNALMEGLGEPAVAKRQELGEVLIADLPRFIPTVREKEQHPFDIITPTVLRLVGAALSGGNAVVMLCRTNFLPWNVNNHGKEGADVKRVEGFLDLIRSYFPKALHEKIMASTTHKYKGLEKPVVIILDAVTSSYPLVHPSSIFFGIFGDTPEKIEEEERRLFYVALTRAAEQLIIVTEQRAKSPFLARIERGITLSAVDWDSFPPVAGKTSCLVVKIGNQSKQGLATFNLKEALKASGYKWQSTGWKSWAKSFSSAGFNIGLLKKQIWATNATGVEVQIFDDRDNIVARYLIAAGEWQCVFDKLSSQKLPE